MRGRIALWLKHGGKTRAEGLWGQSVALSLQLWRTSANISITLCLTTQKAKSDLDQSSSKQGLKNGTHIQRYPELWLSHVTDDLQRAVQEKAQILKWSLGHIYWNKPNPAGHHSNLSLTLGFTIKTLDFCSFTDLQFNNWRNWGRGTEPCSHWTHIRGRSRAELWSWAVHLHRII